MFNESVNLLLSEGRNPSTESQQQLYNEFVQAYGTFYVSNAIVGGMAHLYTFVGENYHRSYSYQETTMSISLTAQYKGVSFQAGIQTEAIYQRISESFKLNSDTMSVFQPPVASVNNQSLLEYVMIDQKELFIFVNDRFNLEHGWIKPVNNL